MIQKYGRPIKSFDDTTRATAFTGSPKGRVTRDGAVLAMTTCLTRMRPLASTREAPVVGGQPASGATTNNPRTQNPTSPAPLSENRKRHEPMPGLASWTCLDFGSGVASSRESWAWFWCGAETGDKLCWRHMVRSFGPDLVHGMAAWNPSTGLLAGGHCAEQTPVVALSTQVSGLWL